MLEVSTAENTSSTRLHCTLRWNVCCVSLLARVEQQQKERAKTQADLASRQTFLLTSCVTLGKLFNSFVK